MIKSFSAYTNEIDDVEAAVSELLEQLDLDGNLLANTVGIVSCFTEYVDSGVLQELSGRLPFQVVGCTTIANGSGGEIGETMLALLVLTSDDVFFSTAVSEPLTEEDEAPLRACYESAAAGLPGAPSLMISFFPLLTSVGGDFYVERMNEITGNVPNFGTLCVDHNPDYHDSRVLLGGEGWRDRLVLLLLHGNVDATFYVGAISDDKVFQDKGVVTAAKGNQLQTVNGAPVADYLQTLGLTKNDDGSITGINTFPIIVDYNDGTQPVARAMFALTPEGHAVCGGNIPVGSTLSIGSFDPQEIVDTTTRTLDRVVRDGGHSALLIFSCIGRYFAQGYDQTVELELVRQKLGDTGTAYLSAYSGGELSPVYGADGAVVNRNHNNSMIICAIS